MQYKVLITGTMGAGKTTAVSTISEITPINTDVPNTDRTSLKALTTVGLDYGEVTLSNGDKLRVYGTPGQGRFDFMWKILAEGALGLVILIDNSRPEPVADFEMYLDGFSELIKRAGCVVGVGRTETHPEPSLDIYANLMAEKGVLCPVVPIDVRESKQVLFLLDLLLTQIEAKLG